MDFFQDSKFWSQGLRAPHILHVLEIDLGLLAHTLNGDGVPERILNLSV